MTTPNASALPDQTVMEISRLCAALEGLIKHVNACDEYKHLRGDMWYVDIACKLLSTQAQPQAQQEWSDEDILKLINKKFHPFRNITNAALIEYSRDLLAGRKP